MNFVLNRNKTVTSKYGHAIEFKKGVPTHVPKEAWDEVIATGAIPENELEIDEETKVVELTAEQRKAAIFAAFEAIVAENDRESFTGNGLPDAKKVSEVAGFTVKADERTATWGEYRAAKEGE